MVPRDDSEGDWVLFRAESDLGPWLRRSAGAHTLIVGSAFALLLLVLTAQALRTYFPADAGGAAILVLLAAAIAAAVPLPLLTLVHGRRRIDAVSVDPQGLTLEGPRRVVRVPFARLREVRTSAEPAFGRARPVRHGELREIPGFHAVLDLRLDGARYEFVSARSDDVAGLLAWLDVLGAGGVIRREPSHLAAEHHASDALGRATVSLVAAVAAVAVAAAAQLGPRAGLAVPEPMLVSLGGIAIGCALYAASYVFQLRAAQAWLSARGLLGAPPGPAADADALAQLPATNGAPGP